MTHRPNTIFIDDFPTWAIYYVTYGEDDSLTDDDRAQVNQYMSENNATDFYPIYALGEAFSKSPAFGLACTVYGGGYLHTKPGA